MNIADLKRLAGIRPIQENPTFTATNLKKKEKQLNLKPGDPDWFRLWFAKTKMTGEMPYENYKRESLPQLSMEDLKGVPYVRKKTKVSALIPVQKERVQENLIRQYKKVKENTYNPIIIDCDNKIINGHHRYSAAIKIGIKEINTIRLPYTLTSIIENFADRKKPGRKGLAKRSGVNCKQSVSKLRKIARNASGEKRRMAHWCANMKSGKKKKRKKK